MTYIDNCLKVSIQMKASLNPFFLMCHIDHHWYSSKEIAEFDVCYFSFWLNSIENSPKVFLSEHAILTMRYMISNKKDHTLTNTHHVAFSYSMLYILQKEKRLLYASHFFPFNNNHEKIHCDTWKWKRDDGW
jgi:hypothetical protein